MIVWGVEPDVTYQTAWLGGTLVIFDLHIWLFAFCVLQTPCSLFLPFAFCPLRFAV